jgi:hypothetical protein
MMSKYISYKPIRKETKRLLRLVSVLHANFFNAAAWSSHMGGCTYIFRRNSVTCLPFSDSLGMNF